MWCEVGDEVVWVEGVRRVEGVKRGDEGSRGVK
jgi:hypothetical protein